MRNNIVPFMLAIAALALAGCAPAPAHTVTTQQLVTDLSKGHITDPGDKVTIAWAGGLLAGRQLVLVQGRAAGQLCWRVDPSTTLPPAALRRTTTRENCDTKNVR